MILRIVSTLENSGRSKNYATLFAITSYSVAAKLDYLYVNNAALKQTLATKYVEDSFS